MSVALLDVNVLIALLWPAHEHHEAAHGWFAQRGRAGWATCPLTELGFVRIVSSPAFSPDALAPSEALTLLQKNLAHPRHEFWPDDRSVVEAIGRTSTHLQGARQLTDAYLLSIASRRKGVLASFDTAVRTLATGPWAGALEVVPAATARRHRG